MLLCPPKHRMSMLLLGTQLAHLLVTSRFFFDRHLLILCPTAVVLFCALLDDRVAPKRAASAALLLAFALYGIAGTHDLHSVSRTAFQAGTALIEDGVGADRIDGGYAFDGWHVYERQAPNAPRRARGDDAWWVRFFFPSIRTDYVVSLSPALDQSRLAPYLTGPDRALFLRPSLERYRVYRTYPYRSYWPPATKSVYVLVDRSDDP